MLADGYFLVDTHIGYQGDNWGVFFCAENFFDEDYLQSVALGADPTPFSNLNRPRTLGVILDAEFWSCLQFLRADRLFGRSACII